MRYDGDFQVGIHGSGALMQDIPDVIENWVKTLPEDYINPEVESEAKYISSMLQNRLESIPNTEEEATLTWDHFSNIALVVLDFINQIAKTHPRLEIAVGVEITFSVTDTTDYYSFYSPVGSDTICSARVDDDVWKLDSYLYDQEASQKMATVRMRYTAEDVKGNDCTFDFYSNTISLEEYSQYESNPPLETDFGKNLLVMEYSFRHAVLTRKDGAWANVGGQLFVGDDAKEIFGILEEAFEHNFSVDDFFSRDRSWWEYPEQFITYLFKICMANMELDISVEYHNEKPHFISPDGGEYFFGCMMERISAEAIAQWNFPEEAHFFDFRPPRVELLEDEEDWEDDWDDEDL